MIQSLIVTVALVGFLGVLGLSAVGLTLIDKHFNKFRADH